MKYLISVIISVMLFSLQTSAQQGKIKILGKQGIISASEAKNNPESVAFIQPVTSALKDTTIELKWDVTEPVGYMTGLSKDDTICVTFNAIKGGILDSVKIALANEGTSVGGIYQFTNKFIPSPLGKPLAVPVIAEVTKTTEYPYAVPFDNWATINLKANAIKTDYPFVVAFVVGEDSLVPGFMVSQMKSKTSYHSFTYFDPASSGPAWYYLAFGDSIYIYLIRAYVRLSAPTALSDLKTTISTYSLLQNFPNPFNPETVIKYSLAEEGTVKIKVINILGAVVSEPVNETKPAGEYSLKFRPSEAALPSGIYFYSIEVNSLNGNKAFSAVKKMAYIK